MSSVFKNCRNEFYMPKYPNNHMWLLGYFGMKENGFLHTNFRPYYSMAMWRKMGPKIMIKYVIIVIFDFWRSFHLKVTSMNSIVFMQFMLVTFRWKDHKKQKITIIRYFILFLGQFSPQNHRVDSQFSKIGRNEPLSTCQNTLITTWLLWVFWHEKRGSFLPIFEN